MKKQGVLWATVGLLLLVAALLGLRALDGSRISVERWLVAGGVTVGVQTVLWLIPHLGWDDRLSWDHRYLVVPMLAAALLMGLYVYLEPEARYLILMAWFVALLFMIGLAGGLEVVALGSVMTGVYLVALYLRARQGADLAMPLELVRGGVFLAINGYAGAVFGRIRSQHREMRQLREKLAEQAVTDPLTGLPNRRYFEDFLKSELERIGRYGGRCAVAMIDVDDFKNYNDTLGHVAGDEVLKELAEVFREEVRVSDIVARYGGEEFALIMVNTDPREAVEAGERLRYFIEAHDFPEEDIQPGGHLTVSIGLASYPEDGDSYEELIEEADEALYRAKRSGKNRVSPAA